jgi:hypothetical protein
MNLGFLNMIRRVEPAGAMQARDQPFQIAEYIDPSRMARPEKSVTARVVFALDATGASQRIWPLATFVQSEMFDAVKRLGTLDVQLLYFRGFSECRASGWLRESSRLRELMTSVQCGGMQTQITTVLRHALKEARVQPLRSVIYVGSGFAEDFDSVAQVARELAQIGVPIFAFYDSAQPLAGQAFVEMARITHGVALPFSHAEQGVLAGLLRASALFAVGGKEALNAVRYTDVSAEKLLSHLR